MWDDTTIPITTRQGDEVQAESDGEPGKWKEICSDSEVMRELRRWERSAFAAVWGGESDQNSRASLSSSSKLILK